MRKVKWTSNERVDIPDATALSEQPHGEFRRQLRALLIGEKNAVVRGFKVVPEGSTKRVKIAFNPTTTERAVAVGSVNVPSHTLDYGQLIGDRDSSYIDEGAALQYLDFTGQPNGTYTVEMRYTETDGVLDNRAFINPSTLIENTQAVNTRKVPGWEARFVAVATGSEWIPLATVAWSGVNITSGMITDLRTLLFEGNVKTPWRQTTQDGTGGVPDFSRNVDRDTYGVRYLLDAVHALQRQIQDMKGPTDDGHYDWFSYVHQPPGRAWTSGKTRNLRSLETVTFRIGDGVEDYGDFNGATGLDDCLAYVNTNAATLPSYVKILIMDRRGTGDAQITQTFSTARTYTFAKTIHIEGMAGLQTPIVFSNAAGTYGLSMTSAHLVLRNVNVGLASGSTDAGIFDVKSCDFEQSIVTGCIAAGSTYYALRTTVANDSTVSPSRIARCYFRGRVSLKNAYNALSMRIEDSKFDYAQFRCNEGSSPAGQIVFSRCSIDANSVVYTNQNAARAALDFTACGGIVLRDCSVSFNNDIDGVSFGKSSTAGNWLVENCFFFSSGGSHAEHAIDATYGTGWGVVTSGYQNRAGAGAPLTGCVRGCTFFQLGIIDAGGVLVVNDSPTTVKDCSFINSTLSGAGSYTASIFAYRSRGLMIDNCDFGPNASAIGGVRLKGTSGTTIRGCRFDGRDVTLASTNTGFTSRVAAASAILFDGEASPAGWTHANTWIEGNRFTYWNSSGLTTGRTILVYTTVNANRTRVHNNVFYGCVGYALEASGNLSNGSIQHNQIEDPAAIGTMNGYRCTQSSDYALTFIGNQSNQSAGEHIQFHYQTANVILQGNVSPAIPIHSVGGVATGTVVGFNTAPQMNICTWSTT